MGASTVNKVFVLKMLTTDAIRRLSAVSSVRLAKRRRRLTGKLENKRSRPRKRREKLRDSSREKLDAPQLKRESSGNKALPVALVIHLLALELSARSSVEPRSNSRESRDKPSTSSTRRSVKLREPLLASKKNSRNRPVKIERRVRS